MGSEMCIRDRALPYALHFETFSTLTLPFTLASGLVGRFDASVQQFQALQSFSLLILGATLSTLATLNFSLAFVVGLLASPLAFVRATKSPLLAIPQALILAALSPPVAMYGLNVWYEGRGLETVLLELAKGWMAQGVWTELVVWGVWWPAWIVGGTVVSGGMLRSGS